MIPDGLKQLDQWVVWKTEDYKKPFAPWTGVQYPIDPLSPDNWTSHERALEFVKHREYEGMGFVFTSDDDIVGIDLDDCVQDIQVKGNNVSVQLESPHQSIVDSLDSFTEISQSGTGIHVFVKGDVGGQVVDNDADVEIYDRGRFFCMTGKVVTDHSQGVESRQDYLDDLADEYLSESEGSVGGGSRSVSSTGDFDPDEFIPDSDSEFDRLTVQDVFPELNPPCQRGHPVHGSTTGQNFLVHKDHGFVSTCFSGSCSTNSRPGTVMLPHHLLYMKMKGWEDCSRVREEWGLDARIETWKYAVNNMGVNPLDVPTSILAGMGNRYEIDVFSGGLTSVAMVDLVKQKLKEKHGVGWL